MLTDNRYFPPFTRAEYERRYRMLRDAMEQRELDCLVIYGAYPHSGTDTGELNAQYLSNYAAVWHSYVVFPLKGNPTLIINLGLHVPNAKDVSAIEDVRAAGLDIEVGVAQRLKELGIDSGNIGVVGPMCSWVNITIPVEHHNYLNEMFPNANFQVVTAWYENLRLIKSEEEIKFLERAAALTDVAYEELILATRPGMRHSDLRDVVQGVALRLGGSFPFCHLSSTPMSNPQMAYPDFWPTYRTVEAGHVVMTELPLGIGHYSTKILGTYFVGEPTREYRDLFEAAAAVHEKAIGELKPGMTGRAMKKWVEPIGEAGYTTVLPLVCGWSCYNHPPHVGGLDGSPGAAREVQSDLDFVFRPGHCANIVGAAATPDLQKGAWVGSLCVFTEDGLRDLNKHPVGKLRVV